jgi:hypothetical protein
MTDASARLATRRSPPMAGEYVHMQSIPMIELAFLSQNGNTAVLEYWFAWRTAVAMRAEYLQLGWHHE